MVKYLIADVDGSLTDGKIYIGNNGEAMKAFSVKDGYALNNILPKHGIEPVILTSRSSEIVWHRCEELGIKRAIQGIDDKKMALFEIVEDGDLCCCAYFGDDIPDLECMKEIKHAGGIVGCPADAVQAIKAVADYVCLNRAGEGALREFAEWLVESHTNLSEIKRKVDYALNYLMHMKVSEEDVGKKVFVNDSFYYSILEYETKPEYEAEFESHRNHVDIQIIVKGEEQMDIADISRLAIKENYNADNDVMLWNVPKHMARITLRAGDYIILYPENAHRGAVKMGKQDTEVLKIVGRVKIV